MGDLDYVGTFKIGNIAKVRVHAPSSRNLDWFPSINSAIGNGYSPLIENGTKSWIIYGNDLGIDLDVSGGKEMIRGNLNIPFECIPLGAEAAALNGEYFPKKNSHGLGDIVVNSIFLKKQELVEPKVIERVVIEPKIVERIVTQERVIEKIVTKFVPKVITRVIDLNRAHVSNERHKELWQNLKGYRLCRYSL